MSRTLILTIILITITNNLLAQLVNIEKQRKDLKPGLQGSIDFAISINQNTKDIIQFDNSINTQYCWKRNIILVLNNITILKVRSSQDKYDLINKNFQHIRYNYMLGDTTVTYEFFVQRQQNKIRYIKERFLTGTGFRIRAINSKPLTLYLSPLLMYEYEQLDDSARSFSRMLKGDFYFSGYAKINDIVSVSFTTYYQPALWDLGSNILFEPVKDFRLSSETDISFTIIKGFMEFSLHLQLSYDSRPPEPLREYPLFYSLKNKLTIKF